MSIVLRTLIAATALAGTAASAATISLTNSYSLGGVFEQSSNNYAPQGLGYDSATGELLYAQQSVTSIYRSDLAGNLTGSVAVGSLPTMFGNQPAYYLTAVSADANAYYFTDYTGNLSNYDLYRKDKATGTITRISSETAAYGGYPIDVKGGTLYRSNVTTAYSQANVNQIRISSLATPDSITTTLTLAGLTGGLADFTVDVDSGSIFALNYSATASIRRYSLLTGELLDTYAPTMDGFSAGLTFANGNLYYYDWQNGASTLSVYAVDGLPSAAVPEPAMLGLFGLGAMALGAARRRKA